MDAKNRIIFRVPDEYITLIKTETKDGSDTVFMKKVLDAYFNPPEVEIKEIEKEVEKIVYVNVDGEVKDERDVRLTQMIFDELNRRKRDPEIPMEQFLNSWIQIKFDNEEKYKNKATQNSPSASNQQGTSQGEFNSQSKSFSEYQTMKLECDDLDDWKKIAAEIKADPNLTWKQKKLLAG